ncbi:VOC family protein [Bacillus sp. FSL K6-3431]|uniref:VOC family protein n=1 Tax=Bacillus sp. FSL K6-3431 TaxID=2921500 RepID=UPI0030FA96BE
MSDTRTLRGLSTISYWADDLQAAKEWYIELLGIEPYFERSGPDGRLAYVEFRIGDYQHEFGLIDRSFEPDGATLSPGGVIMYWHVDDVTSTLEKLLSMGAKEYEEITHRGDEGFITASVVDPFGNILGIMYNPHYLKILSSTKKT